MDKFFMYYNAGMVFLVAAIMAFIPQFTRKDIAFGVSIPKGQKKRMPIRGWEVKYSLFVMIVGVILAVIILVVGDDETIIMWSLGVGFIILLSIIYGLYVYFHKKVKHFKRESGWREEAPGKIVVSLSSEDRKVKFSSWWYTIYLVILAGAFIIGYIKLPELPDMLETHFNAAGQVDGWMAKEQAVWMMPLTALGLSLVMFLAHLGISRAKFSIDPDDKKGSSQRQKKFRTKMALFIYVTGLTVLLNLAISHMMIITILPNDPRIIYAMIVLTVLVILVFIVSVFLMGQSGWRSSDKARSQGSETIIKRDDDKYYKLGSFYFNPKDPSLMVEKRFGIGWTFNFGNPLAWLITIAIITIIIISVTR